MALSDSLRDLFADGSVPDDWRSVQLKVRMTDSERVNLAAVLADLGARPAGDGWFVFEVSHVDHPSPDFAAGVLYRLDRGGCGGEVRVAGVTTAAPERRQVGVTAAGEPVYAP